MLNKPTDLRAVGRDYVIFYDASCELCRRSRRFLERVGAGLPMTFVDVNDRAAMVRWPSIDPVQARHQVMLLEPCGRISAGYEAAVRLLAAVRPQLRWCVPLLLLPPIRAVGDRLYRWFSGHRHRISAHVFGS